MNYEKKYKEALEKAKKCLKDGTITNTAISYIETIFPELKESEDERIRKDIISYLKSSTATSPKTWIAWLERKGEQKSQGKLEDDVRRRSTIQVLEYARSLDTYNQYGKADIDKNIAWLEKQGKSALEAINEEKVDNASKVESQDEFTKFERAVKQVMEEAIECGDTHNLKADADMLLNLARNSSWSEEDRKKVNSLCVLLDQMVSSNMLSNKDATEFKDWLKCLKEKYNWKPSDEQIKQLGWIAEQNKNNMIGKELITLYQDLKKLM